MAPMLRMCTVISAPQYAISTHRALSCDEL